MSALSRASGDRRGAHADLGQLVRGQVADRQAAAHEDVDDLAGPGCVRSIEQLLHADGQLRVVGSRRVTQAAQPGRQFLVSDRRLLLRTLEWRLRGLSVSEVRSSYFEDEKKFPKSSIEFDHALVMRDLVHEWHKADDLHLSQKPAPGRVPTVV